MWFLRLLDKLGRKKVILDRTSENPYLERYYIFLKDRGTFPFNVFLHHFLRSDPDDLHCHPWPYSTFILMGGYWEWIPVFDDANLVCGETKVWRGPGHFRTCKANSFHRIELDPTKNCWTLFMPGAKQREWGFLTHKNWKIGSFKWVHHEKYINDKIKEGK